MATDPAPVVMHPVFSPTAAAISLGALLLSVAGTILALPQGVLTDFIPAADVKIILDICIIITTVAGGHLSVTRSLLPSVDKPA